MKSILYHAVKSAVTVLRKERQEEDPPQGQDPQQEQVQQLKQEQPEPTVITID